MHSVPLVDDVPWRPWTPAEVTVRLAGVRTDDGRPVRWAVAAGWAIDLFVGHRTREHEDLEIVVLRDDVPAVLHAFAGPEWMWQVPMPGWLHPLDAPAFAETHQTWLWSTAAQAFVLDVFRDLHEGDTWICRRDPSIRRPWPEVVLRTAEGVPYLAPEIVLLFKAKAARSKDVADLHAVASRLDPGARAWLVDALARVHPRHAWLDILPEA